MVLSNVMVSPVVAASSALRREIPFSYDRSPMVSTVNTFPAASAGRARTPERLAAIRMTARSNERTFLFFMIFFSFSYAKRDVSDTTCADKRLIKVFLNIIIVFCMNTVKKFLRFADTVAETREHFSEDAYGLFMANIFRMMQNTGSQRFCKTTTTANLGIGLAMQGKKVLLIDADAQASLTLSLGFRKPDEIPVTLPKIMKGIIDGNKIPISEGIIRHDEGVDLIPSNISLSGIDANELPKLKNNRYNILRSFVDEIKSNYDYVLIDGMPSLSLMAINSLAAADSVLIPSQPEFLSTQGLDLLMRSISNTKKSINPNLKIDGILFTMVEGRTNDVTRIY